MKVISSKRINYLGFLWYQSVVYTPELTCDQTPVLWIENNHQSTLQVALCMIFNKFLRFQRGCKVLIEHVFLQSIYERIIRLQNYRFTIPSISHGYISISHSFSMAVFSTSLSTFVYLDSLTSIVNFSVFPLLSNYALYPTASSGHGPTSGEIIFFVLWESLNAALTSCTRACVSRLTFLSSCLMSSNACCVLSFYLNSMCAFLSQIFEHFFAALEPWGQLEQDFCVKFFHISTDPFVSGDISDFLVSLTLRSWKFLVSDFTRYISPASNSLSTHSTYCAILFNSHLSLSEKFMQRSKNL